MVEPGMSKDELLTHLRSEHVQMVGISVSNRDLLDPTIRLVREIKRASINQDMLVMIGGSLELSDHAAEIGATFCNDPREAVRCLAQHIGFGGQSKRV